MDFGFNFGFSGRQAGGGGGGLGPIPDMPVTFKGDFDADVGVTVTGALVETWPNIGSIAAASATLINNGGANRPTLVTADADFNGHNSVSFNGSNHLYDNGHSLAAAVWNVDAKHCFLVLSIETYGTSRYVFNDGTPVFGLRTDSGGDGLEAFNQDSGGVDTTPNIVVPAASTPCLVEILHTGGNLSIKIDAGSYQTSASGNTAGAGFGTYLEVGHSADGAGTKLTGKIARMIFHDTVLTGQDLLDAREHLGRTYGVAY